jgi:hypothetical protein
VNAQLVAFTSCYGGAWRGVFLLACTEEDHLCHRHGVQALRRSAVRVPVRSHCRGDTQPVDQRNWVTSAFVGGVDGVLGGPHRQGAKLRKRLVDPPPGVLPYVLLGTPTYALRPAQPYGPLYAVSERCGLRHDTQVVRRSAPCSCRCICCWALAYRSRSR